MAFSTAPPDGQGQGAFQHVGDVDVHGGGVIIWGGVFFWLLREDLEAELNIEKSRAERGAHRESSTSDTCN